MKGLIALDIDGTLTTQGQPIPTTVVNYLNQLATQGWMPIFITGRTFQWAHRILHAMKFPFYLSVQNGAMTLEMPSKKVIDRKYLNKNIIPIMEDICYGEPTDFIIYTGYEHNDQCYYRSKHFSKPLLDYLNARKIAYSEIWHDVQTFETLPIQEFASVKSFCRRDLAEKLIEKIEFRLGLHAPLIKDPFDESYYVIQSTHPEVNKGQALKDLIRLISWKEVVIAAGDDNNDLSMLKAADIKVVMATAPQELLDIAHVIAPPASEEGIIQGLSSALKELH